MVAGLALRDGPVEPPDPPLQAAIRTDATATVAIRFARAFTVSLRL